MFEIKLGNYTFWFSKVDDVASLLLLIANSNTHKSDERNTGDVFESSIIHMEVKS